MRCHLDQRFGLNNMNSSQKDQMIYFRIVLLDNLKSYIYQKKKKKKNSEVLASISSVLLKKVHYWKVGNRESIR